MTPTARKVLIFAAAAALGVEVVLTLVVAAAAYGFAHFGNGSHLGPAGPTALGIGAVVLNLGLAAILVLGAAVLLRAGFGAVLTKSMQAVMMGVAAIQLFMTIVVTGLTGLVPFLVLGGTFALLAGALAVTMIVGEPPEPEPGPVAAAPTPPNVQPPSTSTPAPGVS